MTRDKGKEVIKHGDNIVAIIIYNTHADEGVNFFTPHDFPQQLGFQKRPKGDVIAPHTHKPITRQITHTQEVLFIRSGRCRINLYDTEGNHLEARELKGGDIILLAHGGHGIEVLEDIEFIEIKQGPYLGADDKAHYFE
jgi:uncharacterized protein YjlB